MFDYSGSIHLHSSYSFDGNTDVEQIISIASRLKLDYMVITDHFRIDAKRDGWEGNHNGVLVIVGEEISPRNNHYIAMGIEKPVIAWKKASNPQEYIDSVNQQGGFGLIAHPDHTGAPGFGIKAYEWNDWNVTGYSGISIWDLMTDWQEKLNTIPRALCSYVFPTWALSGPKKVTLQRWDELNKKHKIAGYGEVDNHNSKKKHFGVTFKIFPFEYALSTIRTHVLLKEPLSKNFQNAKQQIFDAIKSCRIYVSQDYWTDAKGFNFTIFNKYKEVCVGEDINLMGSSASAEVQLPAKGFVKLLCDGKTIKEVQTNHLIFEIQEPGVYRVEIMQKIAGKYKPWIYSNPIWVRA